MYNTPMCFSIPYQIIKKERNAVLIEGGKRVTLGSELHASVGDYVRIVDTIAVDIMTREDGDRVRELIQELNQ